MYLLYAVETNLDIFCNSEFLIKYQVFFPMLSRLMEEEGKMDIEETRMRACNLLCKVFLQRLPQLSSLRTFTELWVGILDTMDKYMHIEGSELLVRH